MKLSTPFISATAFALSGGLAMTQDLGDTLPLPTFEFNQNASFKFNQNATSTCDQDVNIAFDGLSSAQRALYHRAAIIGCELSNFEAGRPNFLNQQVSMLQSEIIARLEEYDVETSVTPDGILGPITAEGFVDYAMTLEIYEVFSPELIGWMGPSGSHIIHFINELERYDPANISLARNWAALQYEEDGRALQESLEELLENFLPSPETYSTPACTDTYQDIFFEGPCYYEARFEQPPTTLTF